MNTTCDQWINQFWQALDGELSDQDSVALAVHIRDCEACRASVHLAVAVHRRLLEAGNDGAILRGKEPQNRARLKFSRSKIAAIVAAAAIMTCVLLIQFVAMRNRGMTAMILAPGAGAKVVRDGKGIVACAETALMDGDTIVTAQSVLRFQYAHEQTFVSVDPNTSLTLHAIGKSKHIQLQSGRIAAVVAKQPGDAPMLLLTAHVKATVVGTEFTFQTDDVSSRLDVSEGRVRLKQDNAANTVVVGAGEYAIASGTGAAGRIFSAAAAKNKDVTAFGADPLGVADSTAAIQKAIDAAASGDTVFIPPGTYAVGAALKLKSGIRLRGVDASASVLKHRAGEAQSMLLLEGISNAEISDLTLDGNNSETLETGIYGHRGSGHRIHHLRIENFRRPEGATGILFNGADGQLNNQEGVTGSSISDTVIQNIAVNSKWGCGIRMSWGSSSNRIERNTITDTGRGGIFGNDGSKELIIQHNIIAGSGKAAEQLGIEVWHACDGALIEDNTLDQRISVCNCDCVAVRRNVIRNQDGGKNPGREGIYIVGNDIVVTDNSVDRGRAVGIQISAVTSSHRQYYAYNMAQGMSQYGMQLLSDSGPERELGQLYFFKNKITQTTRSNDGGKAELDGRGFFLNATNPIRDITLDSNEITANAAEGIYFYGDVDRIRATHNIITDNIKRGITEFHGQSLLWSDNTVMRNRDDTQPVTRGAAAPAPTVDFSCPAKMYSGKPVTFTINASEKDLNAVLWDFGARLPATESSPNRIFDAPGAYRVTLLIWDKNGRAGHVEKTIEVMPSGNNGEF